MSEPYGKNKGRNSGGPGWSEDTALEKADFEKRNKFRPFFFVLGTGQFRGINIK